MKQSTQDTIPDSADIVIIGNGIAGLTAALEARRLDPQISIALITRQPYSTINTPALKQFAVGKLQREQLLAHPVGTERRAALNLVQGSVETIQAQQRYITLEDKRQISYGSLLIATGSSAQGLKRDIPGSQYDGVITLHRLIDYLDFRRRLPETQSAVVIGGGVHAAETVMVLHSWGIQVHWLLRGGTFLRGTLDEPASELVLNHLRRQQGIEIYPETEIGAIVGHMGCVGGVVTTQDRLIPCQLVVACTGTKAVLTLARNCSTQLHHHHGILVDDLLRTNVPGIYAAGDVAAVRDPLTGQHRPRAQWYAATIQGRLAGAMLVGRTDLNAQAFGVPWHATHIGEMSLLSVGHPLINDPQVSILSDTSQGGYRKLAFYQDRLIGYLSLGHSQPDSLAIKALIDEGYPVQPILKQLLKGTLTTRDFVAQKRTYQVAQLMATGVNGRRTVPLQQPVTAPLRADPVRQLQRSARATFQAYEEQTQRKTREQFPRRATSTLPEPETPPKQRTPRATATLR